MDRNETGVQSSLGLQAAEPPFGRKTTDEDQRRRQLLVDEGRADRAGSLSLDKQYADYFPIFRVTAPLAPNVSQFATLRQGKPDWEYRRIKRFPRIMHIAIAGVMRRLEGEGLAPDAYWVGVDLIDHDRHAPWPIFCAQFGDCFVGLARWDVVGKTRWG